MLQFVLLTFWCFFFICIQVRITEAYLENHAWCIGVLMNALVCKSTWITITAYNTNTGRKQIAQQMWEKKTTVYTGNHSRQHGQNMLLWQYHWQSQELLTTLTDNHKILTSITDNYQGWISLWIHSDRDKYMLTFNDPPLYKTTLMSLSVGGITRERSQHHAEGGA